MLLSPDLSQKLLLCDDLFLENLLLPAEQNLNEVDYLFILGYTLSLFVHKKDLLQSKLESNVSSQLKDFILFSVDHDKGHYPHDVSMHPQMRLLCK